MGGTTSMRSMDPSSIVLYGEGGSYIRTPSRITMGFWQLLPNPTDRRPLNSMHTLDPSRLALS